MTDNEAKMRLDAYYYGFEPTGVEAIDRILSAVACAGKAYHYTESWTEETPPYEPFFRGSTPAEWIQNAAIDAAKVMKDGGGTDIRGDGTDLRRILAPHLREFRESGDNG